MLYPVILCGGKGARLWPQSRESYPKQLLTLAGNQSLLQETALRAIKLSSASPIIICHHDYRFIVAEQLQNIGVENPTIILEPASKNTAMAIAVVTQFVLKERGEPDATLAFLPADHYIDDDDGWLKALQQATTLAEKDSLVTLSVKPNKASEAYGYIELGEEITPHTYKVKRFIEKPTLEKAKALLANANYRWNAGIFVSKCKHLSQLFQTHAADVLRFATNALSPLSVDMDFIRPNENAYNNAPNIAFDYAICEKVTELKTVTLDLEWSDLGAWQQVYEVKAKDKNNNVLKGDVITRSVTNSLIQSDDRLVAAIGLDNCIIIENKDAVLVCEQSKSQEVKDIVQQLQRENRIEAKHNLRIHRPWGYYETLDIDNRFKVKRIIVKPKASLSLQKHFHRSEHWVVVKGTASVECDGKQFLLYENQSTYIPQTATHRLSNAGKIPLEIIEVQVGSYLGEDDIERYHDNYDRQTKHHDKTYS